MSGGEWLDSHFSACRAEYEAMLRLVPFPRAGVILDAGCGRGQYLPLLANVAGSKAKIIALDVAQEHLAGLDDSCDAKLAADVTALPFASSSLDGVWCANVTQYFGDAAFRALLAEFSRVLRPGGLLAIKDLDMTGWRVEPAPAFLGLHLAEASAAPGGSDQSAGSVRGRRLGGMLLDARFEDVQQHTQVIERAAPLDAASAAFWAEWLVYLAGVAGNQRLPEGDAAFWQAVSTRDAASAFVTSPGFYGCEMQVVAWGRKPEDAAL